MEDISSMLEMLLQGPYGWFLAGVWGALWGSFFNVVIVRLPHDESLVQPASHCRHCKMPLRWYDNVPLLSYLLLRGRCRRCKARYSPRYVMIEAIVCLLSVALYWRYVDQGIATFELRLAQFFIASLFAGLLIAISAIDLETFYIYNSITYPGIPLAVLLSLFFEPTHLWDGALGAVLGYALIRAIADGYRLVKGKAGMGYGDAKLLAMIGGLLGWQAILPVMFLASIQGSFVGVPLLILFRRRQRQGLADENMLSSDDANVDNASIESSSESLRYARLPFGPFLSLGAIEMLLAKEWIMLFFPYLN